jgi:hypothetical protein
MACPPRYDLFITDDQGVGHGLICDWAQGGAGLKFAAATSLDATAVSTKGDFGIRDVRDSFRTVQTDWSEGSGQALYDRDQDSASCFLDSVAIDVSEVGSLRLGPKTIFTADTDTSSVCCPGLKDAGGYPLVWRGDLSAKYLQYSKDGITWSEPAAHTHDNGATPTSLCCDGAYIYGCFNGVVTKSTIADTQTFSSSGTNLNLTHCAIAAGVMYAANSSSDQIGSFSSDSPPVWSALSPPSGAAINLDGGTTFGLVAGGTFVFWGTTNGMVTKVYRARYAGGSQEDTLEPVAIFPTGFVGESMFEYLGTIYVGGHYDAETKATGRGAIYAVSAGGTYLLTDVGSDTTQAWGVTSMAAYEKSLYFLSNGHVYRWDLVHGGYTHVMDLTAGQTLSVPGAWTKEWTLDAVPASPAVVTNTGTTVTYDGEMTLVQDYVNDTFKIEEAASFVDSTGEVVEVDVPANGIYSSRVADGGYFKFGIIGSVKDVRVRMFWDDSLGKVSGEMLSGTASLGTFEADAYSAHTYRLTLLNNKASLYCDGVALLSNKTASTAKSGTPGVWVQKVGPSRSTETTSISAVRWSTAGVFDDSSMPSLSGSGIACARDKVWGFCSHASLGGCQITSTTEYVSSGSLTSSKTAGNMPTVDKYFSFIDVQLRSPLVMDGSTLVTNVEVAGTVDGIAFVGELDDDFDPATDTLMRFAIGRRGHAISYTMSLSTSDSFQTPIIDEVAVLFTPMPKTVRVHTYFVRCWEHVESRVPGLVWDEQADLIADWLETIPNTIISVDRPSGDNYTGTVEELEYMEAPPSQKARGREGLYKLIVREVSQ